MKSNNEIESADFRCGFAAIVGRPNVGKSTLLNRIIGQKIAITSSRPQTTRHKILGIKTLPEGQIIYVDTPGLHRGAKSAINRYMNRTARSALSDVDAVVWVIEALHWTEGDQDMLTGLAENTAQLIGLENGDPIDTTNYKLNHRRVFHGMALSILQVNDDRGAITLRASSRQLGSVSFKCR